MSKKEKIKTDDEIISSTEIDLEKSKLLNDNQVLNDKILRLSAEMQNMKRRYEEHISNILKYDGEQFIISMLSILDNFERAIKLDDNKLDDQVSKFLDGFKLTYANMKNIFEEAGVKEIICQDQEFDHTMMAAVLTEKVEGVGSNKVIEVLQKGYTYNDKVIRFAMVKVSE